MNFGSSKNVEGTLNRVHFKKKPKKNNTNSRQPSSFSVQLAVAFTWWLTVHFSSGHVTGFSSAVSHLNLARAVEPSDGRLDLEPSELTAQNREVYQIQAK